MTPELVSNVSKEDTNEHGVPDPFVKVSAIDPTTSARVPDVAIFENGKLTEKICPLATVKVVAVPIAVPVEPTNEIEPVHDAAVPEDDALAVFKTLIWALSVLPIPTGPKLKVCV